MQRRDHHDWPPLWWFTSPFGSMLLGLIPLFLYALTLVSAAILQCSSCPPILTPLPLPSRILYMSTLVVFSAEIILAVVWLLHKQVRRAGVILLVTLLSNLPALFLVFVFLFLLGVPIFYPR